MLLENDEAWIKSSPRSRTTLTCAKGSWQMNHATQKWHKIYEGDLFKSGTHFQTSIHKLTGTKRVDVQNRSSPVVH